MAVRIYDRWGHLQCMGVREEEMRRPLLGGGTYLSGDPGPVVYDLVCECRHEFAVYASDFPGKRKMRDCGQDGCPFAQARRRAHEPKRKSLGRPPRSYEVKTILNLYVDTELAKALWRLAERRGLSRSQVASEMLATGLAIWNEDDEVEEAHAAGGAAAGAGGTGEDGAAGMKK